jgi:hypothetical protein
MAGDVKSPIAIGLVLLLLVLCGVVGFLISQSPRQITLTLTETLRETLTLGGVNTVTVTVTAEAATPSKREPTLPRVNLSWEPARTVNDKIYDIRVRFLVISDGDPIVSAKLIFMPEDYSYFITRYGMRPQDYEIVFPNDTRVIDLYPVDGVFNGIIEEFTTTIRNITGGVEYKIKVAVKDSVGRETTTEIKTPYIRQFENIACLDDYIVLSPYYLWYRRNLSNWRDGHKYMPLLGEYRSDDPIVMSKHIDWATGHGIDGFLVSWMGYEYEDLKYFDDNLKLLFNNSLSKDVLIAILYESPGRLKTTGNPNAPWEKDVSASQNLQTLLFDLEYISKIYFGKENYFRINSRPVVYIYDSAAFIGDVETAINKLRDHVKNVAGYELYLISDHVHPYVLPGDNKEWEMRASSFDGVTSWLGGYSGEGRYLGGSYETQLEILYSKWGEWANEHYKKLFPFITPEFDNRYVRWGNPNSIPLRRSPQLFEERMNVVLMYTHPPRVILIGT